MPNSTYKIYCTKLYCAVWNRPRSMYQSQNNLAVICCIYFYLYTNSRYTIIDLSPQTLARHLLFIWHFCCRFVSIDCSFMQSMCTFSIVMTVLLQVLLSFFMYYVECTFNIIDSFMLLAISDLEIYTAFKIVFTSCL